MPSPKQQGAQTKPSYRWCLSFLALIFAVVLSFLFYSTEHTPDPQINGDAFKVVDLPGRGKGVIALRDIKASPFRSSLAYFTPDIPARRTSHKREALIPHPACLGRGSQGIYSPEDPSAGRCWSSGTIQPILRQVSLPPRPGGASHRSRTGDHSDERGSCRRRHWVVSAYGATESWLFKCFQCCLLLASY